MDKKEPVNKARTIVFKLIDDITDRRGLKKEFNALDSDIQEELIGTWEKLVSEELRAEESTSESGSLEPLGIGMSGLKD